MNGFNYEESLEKIKSALFDIYEDEEHRIAMIEDTTKDEEQKKYMELKEKAGSLLQEIKKLYTKSDKENNADVEESSHIEEADIQQNTNEEAISDEIDDDYIDEDDVEETTAEELLAMEPNNDVLDNKVEENKPEETLTVKQPERYYIDDRNGNVPNFAYIPQRLLDKLMGIGEEGNNKFYKQDELDTKGIIVRSDQFMKLSLSKKRQEGILMEAKQYRINLATKSREQLEQIGG